MMLGIAAGFLKKEDFEGKLIITSNVDYSIRKGS